MDQGAAAKDRELLHQKPYQCPECCRMFGTATQLKVHLTKHAAKTVCECVICGSQFKSMKRLRLHTKRMHCMERPYVCAECHKPFPTRNLLVKHVERYYAAAYACQLCNEHFKLVARYRRHVQYHNVHRLFRCTECGKSYRSENLLRRHARVHSGEKPFCCQVCGRSFAWYTNLKRHGLSHGLELGVSCDYCGKKFPFRSRLVEHMWHHTGVKPFSCPLCDESYTTAKYLRDHIQSRHSDGSSEVERKLKAIPKPSRPVTERDSSEQKNDSQRHVCNVCRSSYTRLSDLKVHERKHKGERPYQCTTCEWSFRRLSHLAKHIKVKHRVCMPFICKSCGLGFDSSELLLNHIKEHSPEDRHHFCRYCGKSFKSMRRFIAHQRDNHNVKQPTARRSNDELLVSAKLWSLPNKNNKKRRQKRTGRKTEVKPSKSEVAVGVSGESRQNGEASHEEHRYRCKHYVERFTKKKKLAKHVARSHRLPDVELECQSAVKTEFNNNTDANLASDSPFGVNSKCHLSTDQHETDSSGNAIVTAACRQNAIASVCLTSKSIGNNVVCSNREKRRKVKKADKENVIFVSNAAERRLLPVQAPVKDYLELKPEQGQDYAGSAGQSSSTAEVDLDVKTAVQVSLETRAACDVLGVSSSNLDCEILGHVEQIYKAYQCSVCGKCFSRPSHLKKHNTFHVSADVKMEVCDD